MAGIYIHIPFCRKVCFYCDFHFTVSVKNKDLLIESICEEARLRNQYFKNTSFNTIYFGGGTPSVCTIDEIKKILEVIYKNYSISENPEITLETNPDDLKKNYLRDLKKQTLVNRLSIGIQSFNNKHLAWMNRRHNVKEVEECVKIAKNEGFNNINADLLYGIPGMTMNEWKNNLKKLINLDVQHISAYHLTIEPDTVFGRQKKKGLIKEISEKKSYSQFEILLETMKSSGFDHYEISNFAKEGFYSIHNLNYWNLGEYIGLGPSAHSFDGVSRQWNVRINSKYIEELNRRGEFYEKEILQKSDLFNEYIMVSLRTKWGVDLDYIKEHFGENQEKSFLNAIGKFEHSNHVTKIGKKMVLTDEGKFISDHVIRELFV